MSRPRTAATPAVVSPGGDDWSFYIQPTTLECSASSRTLRRNPWIPSNHGYCGTFVTVGGVMYGMDVWNWPWQPNSAHPTPYEVVSTTRTGIGSVNVVRAGLSGVQVTQNSRYNTRGDGWISTVTVVNNGTEEQIIEAQIVAGACAYWNGANQVERLYDPATGRASCRNGMNVVTFEPAQDGVGWYTGSQNIWGQGRRVQVPVGESFSFTTEIIWHKDGAVPEGAEPLPDWYGPSPNQTVAGGSPDVSQTQCDCADPVNSATGEYWQTVTDLALPGRSPLELTRTYSSASGATTGIFGPGWSSLLDTAVIPGDPVRVVHANGSSTEFRATAGGALEADPDVRSTLTQDQTTGAFTYHLLSGSSYLFDAAGVLSGIVDRNGESTTISRTASSITVTTPDGRTATYQLDANGRAAALTGPADWTVGYTYDAEGRLETVVDARGSQWHYSYDADGRMVGEAAPLSGEITTTYDDAGRVATQTNRRGGVTTFAYSPGDGAASTTRVTDPAGVVTEYAYDHGLLVSKTLDPDGVPATWTYTYNVNGDQETATTPTGERVWRSFDDQGRVLRRVDEAGLVTTYTYGDLDVPLTQTDVLGTTVFTYDDAGNLLTESRPRAGVDATLTLTRAPDHPADVLSMTDPDGRVTQYTYDNAGFRISRTAADGGMTTWTRTPFGQPLTEVSARGNAPGASAADFTTTYDYDSAGALTSITDPLGHEKTYGIDAEGRATEVTSATGQTTHVEFLGDGSVGSTTDPAGNTTTYTLDSAGRLTALTTPDGAITTTEYDTHGWPVRVTSPSGNTAGATPETRAAFTTTITYDLSGRETSRSVPNPTEPTEPIVTRTGYDSAGRLASVTDALGNTTTYEYGYNGLLSAAYEPTGGVLYYAQDEYADVTAVTNEVGQTTTTEYSPAGLVQSVTNGANQTYRYGYDDAGRLTSIVDPRGTCTGCNAASYTTAQTYDLDGNLVTSTNQLGRSTTRAYDAAGRLTSVKDPNNHTTSYTYDEDNNLLTTTAPDNGVTTITYNTAGAVDTLRTPRGNTYTYGYDPNGRILSTTDPLGRTVNASYTPEGLLDEVVRARGTATTTQGDGTTSYDYDPLGRVTDVTFSDGSPSVALTYDSGSRITAIQDAAGTETREYNANGQLTSRVRNSETWTYEYDLDGTLTSITRPDSSTETRTYDAAGRHRTSTTAQGTTTFTYDRASHLTQVAYPNATSETITWDRAGNPATIATKRGTTTLASQTITRDNAGNPTQVVVSRGGRSETRSYLYDASDRLQAVCYVARTSCTGSSAATQYWTYDKDGNRLTEKNGTGTGTTTTYTYDVAGQLVTSKVGTAAATGYTYDADGNLVTSGTTSWTYDLNNRVATTTTPAGTATTTRDSTGNPTSIAAPTGTATYQWDINSGMPTLASATRAGATTDYWYDPIGRLATITSEGTAATAGHDPIGTPTDFVGATGTLARSYDYTPFGTTRTAIGAPSTPTGPTSDVGYAGLLATPDSAALAARDRAYHPAIGRWSGNDPIGIPTAQPFQTPYNYVSNAPNRYVDPLGQIDCDYYSDACATGEFMVGAAKGVVSAIDSLIDGIIYFPVTLARMDQACRAAAHEQMYGGAERYIYGTAACIDAVNPFAQIRDDIYGTFNSPCMEEAGKHFGRWYTNTAMIVAPFARGVPRGTSSAPSALPGPLATTANEAVFWSGLRGSAPAAESWARANGGLTLEMTLAREGITLPQYNPADAASVRAWEAASLEFASSAAGDVVVLQGSQLRISSIWAKEFEALTANPRVTSITAVDPTTGGSVLLWLP